MININQVLLAGYLTADAELRYTKNQTPVITFRMATNKKVKETVYTQYHNIVLWQNAEDYGALLKGDYVQVVGELQTRSYEKDNAKKYITEVTAHTLTLGVKKNEGTQSNFENFNNEKIPF